MTLRLYCIDCTYRGVHEHHTLSTIRAGPYIWVREASPATNPNIQNTFQPKPYTGPDSTALDLLRTSENGPRIFVQAKFPNGDDGLFMVDTGAAISTLSEKTAERLGLALERNYGSVEGLGGTPNFHRTTLPTLGLGDARLSGVEFAVGVRGVPEFAYFMPLDGILGNNVWSHFYARD